MLEGSEDRIFQGLEGFLLLSRTIGLIRCGVCKLRLYLQRPVECCRLPRDRSAWPASRHKHHYQRTLDNKGLQRQQDGEICLGLGNGWSWTNIIRVTRTPSPLLCETYADGSNLRAGPAILQIETTFPWTCERRHLRAIFSSCTPPDFLRVHGRWHRSITSHDCLNIEPNGLVSTRLSFFSTILSGQRHDGENGCSTLSNPMLKCSGMPHLSIVFRGQDSEASSP